MYRALALKALNTRTALDDEAALVRLTEATQIILEPRPNDTNRVLLDGNDVTRRIREKDVSEAASQVSVHPRVRAWMVERQRALGQQGGVVMEGRDIGTKVFPDAELKIFLDAQDEIRGQRRYLQSAGSNDAPTPEAVLAAVRDRDSRDRNRTDIPAPTGAGCGPPGHQQPDFGAGLRHGRGDGCGEDAQLGRQFQFRGSGQMPGPKGRYNQPVFRGLKPPAPSEMPVDDLPSKRRSATVANARA